MSLFSCCFRKLPINDTTIISVGTKDFRPLRLLKLPDIAMKKITDHMLPFDLIAVSLCSKNAMNTCKNLRWKKSKSRYATVAMNIDATAMEIRMRFDASPDTYWVFYMGQMAAAESETIVDNIYISMWKDEEELDNKKRFPYEYDEQNPCEKVQARQLHYKDPLLAFNSWFDLLSEMFHLTIHTVEMKLKLKQDNIENALYVLNKNILIQQLFCSIDGNDDLIRRVIDAQHAENILCLRMKPSSNFRYEIEKMRANSLLEINRSSWINFDQMCQMDCETAALLNSKFTNADYKMLIEKWREGWNPKWYICYLQSSQKLVLESIINPEEPCIPLEQFNQLTLEQMANSHGTVMLYRYEGIHHIEGLRAMDISGYHIRREDGLVASFYITGEKSGLICIQVMDGELAFPYHRSLLA